MIIEPVKVDFEALGLGISRGHRTPGLHMSDIYNNLFQELEPKRYQKGSAPDALRMELGLNFEDLLEEGLRSRLTVGNAERPGEFTTEEGIIYSPDLIVFNGSTKLGEIKLTWMSSREVPRERTDGGFPPKFDKYFVQMKAYCHNLDLDEARLFAFFVCGNWDRTTGNKPEFLAWDIHFTQRELKENWQMLLNHARHARLLK